MPLYTKESINLLRDKIILSEVIGAYVTLKKIGSTYKGLCPFHEEKSPSFMIRQGDHHYHCFGCGAHGDAITFLMNFQRLGFVESLEWLSERFGVVLEKTEAQDKDEVPRGVLKDALGLSARLYHYLLLHAKEAEPALHYLYQRGITLEFIKKFQLGYALSYRKALQKLLYAKGFSEKALEKSGLLLTSDQGNSRDFFIERIMFPICDGMGNVIGFSGRKFKEETSGGKYVNSPETPLFKKSHVLFGLHYSRKQIMKEKKALIVEGQIDCLRLIDQGFDWTVAGQGTAFGEDHVKELIQLGVEKVYLSLDGDLSGEEASVKIGDFFQKKGIAVWIVELPSGFDPDLLLRKKGKHAFEKLLQTPTDYLTFIVNKFSKTIDTATPAGKQQLVDLITKRIRSWEQPVLVHESLNKLATLLKLPVHVITQGLSLEAPVIPKEGASQNRIDANHILETDFLRLLLFSGEKESEFFQLARNNINPSQLKMALCQRLYAQFLEIEEEGKKLDLLSLATGVEQGEEEAIVETVMSRKVHLDKADHMIRLTIKRLLERNWLEERERIKIALHGGSLSEEEALNLARQFDLLKKQVPFVQELSSD
ncbi:DNA primase [Rhabdochlamydiaceae symbiont of Dictyostelium giganteum]|uniref:DNA primase n=1 Tax=Rhabdochlamydiaceae symbiont of Dictyostelium giganteum TaxID=3342349 RepID=UPI003851514D